MDKENNKQHERENEAPNVVEDLTLNETETENVKGGAPIKAGYDLKKNEKV